MTQAPPSSVASYLEFLAQTEPKFAKALEAHRSGRLDEARAHYLDLLDQPNLTWICLHQVALVAGQKGDEARAVELLQGAIRLDPRQPMLYRSLANALETLGRRGEAIETLMRLVVALEGASQLERSAAECERILALDPGQADACFHLGGALNALWKPAEAVPPLVRGIVLSGARSRQLRALMDGLAPRLLADGLIERALLNAGTASAPAVGLEVGLSELGTALGRLGYAAEEIRCHRTALEFDPGAGGVHFNLATALLRNGDYAEGWREYQWRWQWTGFPEPRRRLPCAPWQGQDLRGRTVLLYIEQGWGDAIQFAPLVKRLAAAERVVFEVTLPLVRLFKENFERGNVEVIGRARDPNQVNTARALDFSIALMDLPARLGLDAGDLPLARRYIGARPDAVAAWRARIDAMPRPRIGLVWAGSARHANDRVRSVELKRLRRLFQVRRASWVSLQVGERAGERAAFDNPLIDVSAELKDFTDTAALVANLDLVLSVDTAVTHLAGAMGKPVWIMLGSAADWRWQRGRSDSPWYPSARLFRQSAAGDWEGLAEDVAGALERGEIAPVP
jgi:tetratricopeptide (TPR) repeat protein